MPRRRKRFDSLYQKLKGTKGTIPSSGEVKGFYDFLTGNSKITVENKVPEGGTERFKFAAVPFGLSVEGTTAAGNEYIVYMTAYSWNGLNNRTTLKKEDFGLYFPDGNEQIDKGYYPALMRFSVPRGAGTPEPQESGVTGQTYTYRPKRSFSVPFGRTVTTGTVDSKTGTAETTLDDVDEVDAFKSLATKLGNQADVNSVSYSPEVFRADIDSVKSAVSDTTIPSISVS